MAVPVYQIKISEYSVKSKPDWVAIGKKVAIRCLGSQEHKGKSVNALIKIIMGLGHDRYDFSKKGDRYENVENKKIDFFALDFKVR
ncbi:hypothetical protein HYU06_03485 [Candidatus Woesearchaeota archaeon]|nr:hypothetical protein [Candidatus Woesearchaeota archaeon]